MKTARQWYKENYTSGAWENWWNINLNQIEAIQQDAQEELLEQNKRMKVALDKAELQIRDLKIIGEDLSSHGRILVKYMNHPESYMFGNMANATNRFDALVQNMANAKALSTPTQSVKEDKIDLEPTDCGY